MTKIKKIMIILLAFIINIWIIILYSRYIIIKSMNIWKLLHWYSMSIGENMEIQIDKEMYYPKKCTNRNTSLIAINYYNYW